MAVVYRSATDDARGTTTNTTPALPPGTVAGDLLIAVQASDLNGSLAAMTAPAGWEEVGSGSRTGTGFLKVWQRIATSAEPATYTFVDSASAHGCTVVVAVSGYDLGEPLAVTPTFANGAAAASHPAPSVAGVAGGLLLTAYLAATGGTTRSYAPPAGMTERQESSLTTAGNICLEVASQDLTTTGATGAKSATPSASTSYVTMSLVVGPTAPVGTPRPAPAWMVLGADTAPELATAKAAGATHGLVEVFWDQCQTTAGGTVDATGVQANIDRVIAAGMQPVLRVSLQYIPTFVDTAAVKFRRNGAVDYNPGNVSGNNARDWVWSASTRALVDDFLDKLFVQLNWAQIDRVQLGGGPAGELQYPDSDGTQWWGYSAPAQTGTDLAQGQVVCPVPGHVPSTGTAWTANDIAFAAWYTQSLNNWMLWLIAKHRHWFSGPIWVLHPGAGLRKVSQTPTGGQALNYRVNLAKGVDWDTQIAAYPDANVHPYSTWVDSPHFAGQPYSDVNDGDAAPWYHLLRIARTRGRARMIWGENTGGQSNTDMDRVFSAAGAVGHGYQGLGWLSHDSLADGTGDTYANLTARIATAMAVFRGYRRGVNMAGGEFAPSAATLPGSYGTDYSYDSATALLNVAARGQKIVRVPFRWERIQPTRNAALNTAELARITQVVADARAAGMSVVLDVHNYARYINSTANGGAELVLGDTLPVAHFVDLWTRLSSAFAGNPGIYGYGLMNEPHDLSAVLGTFSGTTRYDWNDGTVQGWTGDTATATNVGSRLRISATATSGFFLFRKDDAATKRNNTATGNVLRAEVTLGAAVAGSWTVKLEWQTAGFTWIDPVSTTYTRVDNGQTVSGLIAGVAVLVTATHSSITAPNAFAVQVESAAATAGAVSVDVENFAQGGLSGGSTPAQVWENAAQQAVTAIRATGDTTRILVSGYNWSGAKTWSSTHPTPFITDTAANVAYEAHYYFDVDNSGDYPASYSTENTAAVSAGYSSLTSRAVVELQNWTTWLTGNGVRGFLGELGWPSGTDAASWNTVGEALYVEADLHGVDATYWSAGARWGTTYPLSIYTGTNQDVVQPQATVVEGHLTDSAGMVLPTGIASGQALGSPTVAVAGGAQTVSPTGIASAEALGAPTATAAPAGTSSALFPSAGLVPSNTLFPSDGGLASPQTVAPTGIGSSEFFGLSAVTVDPMPDQTVSPTGIASDEGIGAAVVTVANGAQTVVPTPVDTAEAFGLPFVAVDLPNQTLFAIGIASAEASGRPDVVVVIPAPTAGPTFYDTYYVNGVDLNNFAHVIEVAEGLQDTPGTVGDDVVLPGLDGALAVFGAPGQPRRPDGVGRIVFDMWLVGVDPATGNITTGSTPEQDWFTRWDELVRLFHRRQLTVDHPRPSGARRTVATLVPGESMAPTDRAGGSPWFGRFRASLAVPGAHWFDVDPVTTGAVSLPNNGTLSLGAFTGATAPCTELVVTFGPGNNPRLSTSYGHIGYNGTIAPGQQLRIDTAAASPLGPGNGSAWTPSYQNLTFSPGPRLFEIDPSESLSAVLTHTGGGSMSVEVSGRRRYRTS